MSIILEYWCDSGANVHSCYQDEIAVKDLGYTDEQWLSMTLDEQEDAMRDICLDRLDWGFKEKE